MKKKFVCFLLSFAILFCCSVPASSVKETPIFSTESSLEETIIAETQRLLRSVEPEKELYGMGQANFDNLKLGKQIPAYAYTADGPVLSTQTRFYPIMDGTQWVGTATVMINDNGIPIVQVSSEYAEDYSDAFTRGEEVALLFDADSAYIVSSNSAVLAAVSPKYDSTKVKFNSKQRSFSLQTAKLQGTHDLNLRNDDEPDTYDYYYNLPVPCMKQPTGSSACWATCIAAIRSYYGIPTTIEDVYVFANKSPYEGGGHSVAYNTLEKYGFDLTDYYINPMFWSTIKIQIYMYHNPIYATTYYETDSDPIPKPGHAIVIRGYYVYQNISNYIGQINYMDPLSGKYVVSNVASEQDFKYCASGSLVEYDLVQFICVGQ